MAAPTGKRSPRIVILGGGFAGAWCARGLRRVLRREQAEVILVDRHNYLVFYPLLVEAGTGSLEPRHAVVPIRELSGRATFRMAEVTSVDVAAKQVTLRCVGADSDETIACDHLVLALGCVTNRPAIPGFAEYGWELRSLGDAVALRDRAIQMLELANATGDEAARRRLLRLVVVGGSFTGVEVAGEFDEFVRQASRHFPGVSPDECSTHLVEVGGRILAPLGEDLSRFALHHLRKRGMTVHLERTVKEIRRDSVVLDSGEEIATRTVIWSAGIAPNPLLAKIDVPGDERGYVLCERDLRVRGFDDVWAIGDCAVNTDGAGAAYPATAQHAVRLGAHLAASLESVLDGGAARPCDLKSLGSLAAIGCRTGVARVFGIKLAGFPAWFLWRTVYLMKMPRLSRRVRVALDWSINLFFSRDYVQLAVHRRDAHRPPVD